MRNTAGILAIVSFLILNSTTLTFAQEEVVPGSEPLAVQQMDSGFVNAKADYDSGKYMDSAFKFYDVMMNSVDPVSRMHSEYFLAQSFYHVELHQSALYFFGAVFKSGPSHPYYLKAIEGLTKVAEKLRDNVIIPSLFDKYYNQAMGQLEPEVLNKINYIIGELAYRKGHLEESLSFLKTIPSDHLYSARTEYLKGLIAFRGGKWPEAIKIFNNVRTFTEGYNLDRLKDQATMGIARTYYGMGDYKKATEYFLQVKRFSHEWQESLFENGWSYYQQEELGKSLGMVLSVQSPYFADWYVPESYILGATAFFQACLYEEAGYAIEDFMKIYVPINDKLTELLSLGVPPNKYYEFYSGESTENTIPARIKKYMSQNKRFMNFVFFINELIREKNFIENSDWKGSNIAEDQLRIIEQQTNVFKQITGQWILLRMKRIKQRLDTFTDQAKIVRFEIKNAEKDLLQSGVDFYAYFKKDAQRALLPSHLYDYWKFEYEYWEDEVGYYEFTYVKACGEQPAE